MSHTFGRPAAVLALLLTLPPGALAQAPRADAHGDPLPEGARLRVGTTRFRAGESVRAADLSPDGKTLAVATSSGLSLFDVATGRETRRLAEPPLPDIARLEYLRDGRTLAASGDDGLYILDTAGGGGRLLAPPDARQAVGVRSFSVSADGKRLAIWVRGSGKPSRAVVIDTVTGREITSVEALHNQPLNAALSPDGRVLATWGRYYSPEDPNERAKRDPVVQLWDAASGKELRRIDTGMPSPREVKFSPDGRRLATLGHTGDLRLWDVGDGTPVRRFAGRSSLGNLLAFAPDGRALAGACADGVVQLWDAATGGRRGLWESPVAQEVQGVHGLRFVPGNRLIAWAQQQQAVYLWDVRSGKPLVPAAGHGSPVQTVFFTPDGRTLFSAGRTGPIFRWDARTGERLGELGLKIGPPHSPGHSVYLYGVTFDPSGRYVAVWDSRAPGLRVHDVETGVELFPVRWQPPLPSRFQVSFSADGRRFVAASESSQSLKDEPIQVWDTESGLPAELPGQPGAAYRAALSADGKLLAAASRLNVRGGQPELHLTVWDVDAGRVLARPEHPATAVTTLAFTADGEGLLLADGSGVVRLLRWRSGQEVRSFGAGQEMLTAGVVLSPDGRTFAAGVQPQPEAPGGKSGPAKVRVWELASGTLRREWAGHAGSVTALAFSPDGRTLASGSADTTILLWDLYPAPKAAGPITGEAAEGLWAALAGEDGRQAAEALDRLLARPAEAVRLLRDKLKPAAAPAADPGQVRELIAELDAPRFAARERAVAELLRLGRSAGPELERALAGDSLGPEGRERAEAVRARLGREELTAEELRQVRAVEALERIGSAGARELLRGLAEGDAGAVQTRESKAALERLGRQPH